MSFKSCKRCDEYFQLLTFCAIQPAAGLQPEQAVASPADYEGLLICENGVGRPPHCSHVQKNQSVTPTRLIVLLHHYS